jgi:hypothetical protein
VTAPTLRLVADNNLSRFNHAWRSAFARGRIWMREDFGRQARQAGDKDEEARHFLAASKIRV